MSITVIVEGLEGVKTVGDLLDQPQSGFAPEKEAYGRTKRHSHLGDAAIIVGEILVVANFVKTIMDIYVLSRKFRGGAATVKITDSLGQSVSIETDDKAVVEKLVSKLHLS